MIAQKKLFREPPPRPRVHVILQVAGIYFFIILSLIALTEVFDLPLTDFHSHQPTFLLRIILFLYYVFPACLAVVFGAFFRPFILTTARILVFLLLIQFAVSLTGRGLRETYLSQREADIRRSRLAVVRFENFRHRLVDRDADGRVDRADFTGTVTVENLPAGEYQLSLLARQHDVFLEPHPVLTLKQTVPQESTKSYRLRFSFDPQLFAPAFRNGPVELHLSIQRLETADEKIRKLIKFNRWIPFLRTASWEGKDHVLSEQIFDFDLQARIDDLYLLPLDR